MTTEPWTYPETVRTDCRHFRGSVPCQPHKLHGVHCSDASGTACPHYAPTTEQILIIKLGAMGDVLRTTPLLRRLMQTHPQARFWWLTYTPQVIPACVDVVLTYTPQSIALLQAVEFDLLINLDKDPEACALASTLRSRDKKGYTLAGGVPAPVNADAAGKFMTSSDSKVMGKPLQYTLDLREGRHRKQKEVVFEHGKGKALYIDHLGNERKDFDIPGTVFDPISGFFYIRTLDLRVGKPVSVTIFDSKRVWDVEVQVLRKEKITVPAGEFQTIVVKPLMQSEGIFSRKGDVFIWLTDDERKIPVMIQTKVKIGSVSVFLTGIGP